MSWSPEYYPQSMHHGIDSRAVCWGICAVIVLIIIIAAVGMYWRRRHSSERASSRAKQEQTTTDSSSGIRMNVGESNINQELGNSGRLNQPFKSLKLNNDNVYNFTVTPTTDDDRQIEKKTFLPEHVRSVRLEHHINSQNDLIEREDLHPNRRNYTYLLHQQAPEDFYDKMHKQFNNTNV